MKDTINAYSLIVESRAKEERLSLNTHYVEAIEEEYKKYNGTNKNIKPINQVRNYIANELLNRGQNDDAGIYRLDVPTGAGKTKASLRYALHQMADKSKNKFIYITAFLYSDDHRCCWVYWQRVMPPGVALRSKMLDNDRFATAIMSAKYSWLYHSTQIGRASCRERV